jgi:ribonuclease HI
MGIGWVQVVDNISTNSFSSQIKYWPSSYKTELLAVLSAICTAPRNCKIDIFTDSQSIISKFHKLTHTTTNPSHYLSFNCWPIWHTILNLIKSYNFTIFFHKVQAHSDDQFNNIANSLAQNHQTLPYLEFKHSNLYNPNFYLTWEKFPIEQSTRKIVKTICKAHTIAIWSSQNRNQTWAHLSNLIDWNSTWLYLNNNKQHTNTYTNFRISKLKTFRIKLLHNELPTPTHLNKYYPNIITHKNCFKCNQTDSEFHWITCPNTYLLQEIITQSITEVLYSTNLELTSSQLQNLQNLIINHHSLQTYLIPTDSTNLYTTLKGLIPHSLIQTIRPYTNSLHITSQITIKLFLKLNSKLYDQLWLPYCIQYANWKSQHNIHIPHNNIRNSTRNRRNNSNNLNNLHTTNNSYSPPYQSYSTNYILPIDLAIQKLSSWPIHWIKYGYSTNSILINQI